MAKKAKAPRTVVPTAIDSSMLQSRVRLGEESDDELEIRFSLTALGEAVVNDRDRRRPKFRGFGPCARIVA